MERHDPFELARGAIDVHFPLHVAVSPDGEIESFGPTLARIVDDTLLGHPFLDVFAIEKPRSIRGLDGIRSRLGTKLVFSARARDGAPVRFRAVATLLGRDERRLLIDLALGTDMPGTIRRFGLTGAHFRVNDASMDLVHTFEAQQALLEDTSKMARALRAAKEEAERQANVDPVTEIANRRALHARIDALLHGEREEGRFALLQVDLDRFKAVNDAFGHEAGDVILRHTARALEAVAGPADLSARLGGDEFALIVSDAPGDGDLAAMAEDLRARISEPVRYRGSIVSVGASIGIVRFHPGEDTTSDRILKLGDIALYDAKKLGNTATLLTPAMIRSHEAVSGIIAEIEDGIRDGRFIPHFQPQVDTVTDRVVGFEVLARWRHPTLGILQPASFLEPAMRANLLDDIDRSVRRNAIRTFAEWVRSGTVSAKISFNMTASSLLCDTYIEDLLDDLTLVGLPAASVQLELLESILFDKADARLLRQCHLIHEAGFSLALDDFGTGHSAISTLIEVPVSVLKIDRSFVTGLDRNPKLRRITGSMLAMAEQIGLSVLAEGVESVQELEILQASGCRLFQGFHFSPPLAAEEMTEWLGRWEMRSADRVRAGSGA